MSSLTENQVQVSHRDQTHWHFRFYFTWGFAEQRCDRFCGVLKTSLF